MVPPEKVEDYLLAGVHPVGGAKARYFRSKGYAADAPARLSKSLLDIAVSGHVESTSETMWGRKYSVVGQTEAPNGSLITLRTVWIVIEEAAPRLVTAYPAEEES